MMLAILLLATTASACFVATPDTANFTKDLAKLTSVGKEACWAACEGNAACVGADFRQRTGDCWLKSELMTPPSTRPGIDTLTPCITLFAPGDRVAVSADGNFSDEDDIGATPMSLALLAYAGVMDRLVYYGYRSHVWQPERMSVIRYKGRSQDVRMRAAVSEGIPVFGLAPTLFVDEKAHYDTTGQEQQPELIAAINASSADSALWIVGAGPMQTIYASMEGADRASLKYVNLISHSRWNNVHAEGHRGGVSWEEVKRLVIESGGRVYYGGTTCPGCIRPTVGEPHDQNKLLNFRAADDPLAVWTWLRDSSDPRLNFVFDKIEDSRVGDVSDAGMVYYLLTGDEDADPVKLKSFFAATPPICKCDPDPVVPSPGSVIPTVKDFVHRPKVFAASDLRFTYVAESGRGMRRWQDCVMLCIERYGAECLYVQYDRLTPLGTCIISRPCQPGAVCSQVSDVNKIGLDYNRVNCKRREYVAIQEREDSMVAPCRNVF